MHSIPVYNASNTATYFLAVLSLDDLLLLPVLGRDFRPLLTLSELTASPGLYDKYTLERSISDG